MRNIAYVCIFAVMTAGAAPLLAQGRDERVDGPIRVEVLEVHDGDTFTAFAHTWPGSYVKTHVRVMGIDTPELRGRCDTEKDLARQAKALTEDFLKNGAPIAIRNVQFDKYGGRVDADVYDSSGRKLADELIKARLAYAYDGGTKQVWCG